METCKWTFIQDPFGAEFWETECGETWQFTEGGLKDNDVEFCHKCGKKIEEAKKGVNA